MADRYLVVNVSHDNVDFCIIKQARFEHLARAHCPARPSDLVHFVVKIIVEKESSEKIFMLVTFLWYINFSVLFL